ncbi:GLPGLI family protein [Elizabethkingia anophelis]|uniref:GLPGLI family protein n=1 Tax=Elizabethkingia anophelis TaxID=1117645 RepID=UPI00077E3DCF|nr:GLPGLI family protein [Elizabethkingia anophelis]AMR40707.1 GLPGLI family protein [Elizabethkingia anophelis]AMX47343.1 GLPGLI family protein [Elizabethkingia anophelis]AMX50803.1 GLPGLI family protein [Elizabethkingia anophelis]AMX54195.1 GLPGLI family protein [Elizabethkingia anophelis]EGT4345626.1 GLPGLI family protein [Elizabethkingia anophelis]
MKKILYLFLAGYGVLYAQNQKFVYEYKFVPDSTNTSDIKSEITHLEITPKGSVFYSYEVYKSDSLAKADLEKQLKATGAINVKSGMRKGLFRDKILKTYPDFKITQESSTTGKALKIIDDRKLTWKILPDKQKTGNYETQKAEVDFAGRKWTAWFTTEVPIQDGPYKFHGLPGFIVKIEDATKSHIFELKGVSKLVTPYNEEMTLHQKAIEVPYSQYLKIYKMYRKDPLAEFRQRMASISAQGIRDASGNPIDMNKMMKDREQKELERLKKDNNVLELDLIK